MPMYGKMRSMDAFYLLENIMNLDQLNKTDGDYRAIVDGFVEETQKEMEKRYPGDLQTQYAALSGVLKAACYEFVRKNQQRIELEDINKRIHKLQHPTLSQVDIEDCLLSIFNLEIPLTIEIKYKPELIGSAIPLLKNVELWAVLCCGANIIESLSTEEIYNLEQLCINDYLKGMEEAKTEFELRKAEGY